MVDVTLLGLLLRLAIDALAPLSALTATATWLLLSGIATGAAVGCVAAAASIVSALALAGVVLSKRAPPWRSSRSTLLLPLATAT